MTNKTKLTTVDATEQGLLKNLLQIPSVAFSPVF